MVMEIRSVKNGFIVQEGKIAPYSYVNDGEIMVFETFEGLEKYQREYFEPLVELRKEK